MLQAQGSPLVAGAAASQRTARVRVLRPFLMGGQRQEVGTVLEVPASLAPELYQRRAAEPAPEPQEPTPPAPPAAKTTARARASKE